MSKLHESYICELSHYYCSRPQTAACDSMSNHVGFGDAPSLVLIILCTLNGFVDKYKTTHRQESVPYRRISLNLWEPELVPACWASFSDDLRRTP